MSPVAQPAVTSTSTSTVYECAPTGVVSALLFSRELPCAFSTSAPLPVVKRSLLYSCQNAHCKLNSGLVKSSDGSGNGCCDVPGTGTGIADSGVTPAGTRHHPSCVHSTGISSICRPSARYPFSYECTVMYQRPSGVSTNRPCPTLSQRSSRDLVRTIGLYGENSHGPGACRLRADTTAWLVPGPAVPPSATFK